MTKDDWEKAKENCPWAYTGRTPFTYLCATKLMLPCPEKEKLCVISTCAIYHLTKTDQ